MSRAVTIDCAEQFRQAIEQAGLTPPLEIIADGKIHRFPTNGNRGDDSGYYVFHADEVPAGCFGDWRTGIKETWCAKSDQRMTAAEQTAHRKRIEHIQAQRNAEEAARNAYAADRAAPIWELARPAPLDHPYLQRKRINPHDLRIYRGRLDIAGRRVDRAVIVPLYDADDRMWSLQFIRPDGIKLFLPDGRKRGCFHLLGEIGHTIVIAEGFATAASIHEATGYMTAVAFDAGNLLPVALALRAKHPDAQILLCGDNDIKDDGKPNTGLEAATAAAHAINGLLVMPELDGKKCDWNDVHVQQGLDAVKQLIEAALRPPVPSKPEETVSHDDHVDDDDKKPRRSQATQLIELATAHVECFHSTEREPFALIRCGDHREVWPIKSKAFRHYLSGRFFQETKGAIGGQSMQDALSVLSSMALFEGPERPIAIRVAEQDGAIYVDLANPQWEVVKVTADGWSIVKDSPVPFRRPKSMMALPTPVSGGSIGLLRDVINLGDDQQWTLLIGFLVAALRPRGPFSALVIDGEQGTGKTWIAEVIKGLLDPAIGGNRGEPRDVRDLMIAASNGWMLSFDNLSRLSPELSDGLCRLSTGGGLATRELFSDADETIFEAMRPVVINAIGDVVTRPDLVDRSVVLTPAVISEKDRREKHALVKRFHDIRPLVFGALLDAVVCGLKTVDTICLPRTPRMADFAVWVTACAPALGWGPEQFLDVYFANRCEAVEIGLESSPLVGPLRTMVEQAPWEGTPLELLHRLSDHASDSVRKLKSWPTQANVLSNQLKRLAPALRQTGLVITRQRTSQGRGIRLEQVGNSSTSSSSSTCHVGHVGHVDEKQTRSNGVLFQEEVNLDN